MPKFVLILMRFVVVTAAAAAFVAIGLSYVSHTDECMQASRTPKTFRMFVISQ